MPDGYLNTYYSSGPRFQELEHSHELYCLGHLIQAGIAHRRTTGRRDVLVTPAAQRSLVLRVARDDGVLVQVAAFNEDGDFGPTAEDGLKAPKPKPRS